MSVKIKICGLSTPDTLDAAIVAGADYVGLVHYPRSPRHVSIAAAVGLAAFARGRAAIVCLLVDPDDDLVEAIVTETRADYLQLHGNESPQRAAAISQRWSVSVIKAVMVATSADAAQADEYRSLTAFPLFDAKPAPDRTGRLPGGNGLAFDWRALAGQALKGPFMLSGGLNPGNVAAAIRLTKAPMVDVSSGVERAPGVKDTLLIKDFIAAARDPRVGDT